MPANALAPQKVSLQYMEEQLNSLTPLQLTLRVYDVAIASCEKQDRDRLSRALVELMSTLNFEHRDIAVGLFRLYNFCLRQGKMGRFDVVKPILVGLRDTWSEVARATEQAPAA